MSKNIEKGPQFEASIEKKEREEVKAEEAEIRKAYERRLELIPESLRTPGLMLHFSKPENAEFILKHGILSYARYVERFGKEPPVGAGSDMQTVFGAWDYISVMDVYRGCGHTPWFFEARKEANKRIQQAIKDHESTSRRHIARGFEGRGITLEEFLKPENKLLRKKINRILEETMYRDEPLEVPPKDYVDWKTTEPASEPKIIKDVLQYFGFRYGAITFLINPQLKRITCPGLTSYDESFIKDEIKPGDIVGMVVTFSVYIIGGKVVAVDKDEEIFRLAEILARKNGVPLFVATVTLTYDENKRFKDKKTEVSQKEVV